MVISKYINLGDKHIATLLK